MHERVVLHVLDDALSDRRPFFAGSFSERHSCPIDNLAQLIERGGIFQSVAPGTREASLLPCAL